MSWGMQLLKWLKLDVLRPGKEVILMDNQNLEKPSCRRKCLYPLFFIFLLLFCNIPQRVMARQFSFIYVEFQTVERGKSKKEGKSFQEQNE